MLKLYTKPYCPNCTKLKTKLDLLNIDYETIDITRNAIEHAFIVKKGHRSVPQLYNDNVFVDQTTI